jgi:hypothetical protein
VAGVTSETFSVYQFFEDETWERVAAGIRAEAAVKRAKALTETVGARIGTTARVVVTDQDDTTCFEWRYGKGVTFPPRGPS